MTRKLMRILMGIAALAALALGGAALAQAGGGDDDGDEPAAGPAADRARSAALAITRGGTANAVERDGENGATWEVEITRPDGKTVDVRLDKAYKLVVVEHEILRKELAGLRAEADATTAQWEAERQEFTASRSCARNSSSCAARSRRPNANYDLNRAAELRHGRLPEPERRLRAEEERLGQKQGTARLLREEVTEDEIAQVVARWTGIPVARLMEGEREKLLRLDGVLHERVIGQGEAVRLAAEAVIRARAGIKDPSARSARSCSSGPPAWARPSCRARSPSRCSTPRRTWSAWTCPIARSATRSAG